jgi:hypothetical protein
VIAPIGGQRSPTRRSDVSKEDETSKQVEEDVTKDLELKDEDAEKVGGGDSPTPPTPRFDPYKNFKFR